MKDLVIQIVNYKTRAYLIDCLRSVVPDADASGRDYCIAILDNASGDVVDDIPSLFPDCDMRVFTVEENHGFGAGHNFLAQKICARHRLLLNPDTVFIQKDTIQRLLRTIACRPQCAVVGPQLVQENGLQQPWDHGVLHGMRARMAQFLGRSHWRREEGIVPAAWVSGAVFVIRDDAWRAVGGFDERFFLYKEEEDLCLQLRRKGWSIYYNAEIVVRHIGSVVASKSVHMERSQKYFIDKNFNGAHRFFLRLFSWYVS